MLISWNMEIIITWHLTEEHTLFHKIIKNKIKIYSTHRNCSSLWIDSKILARNNISTSTFAKSLLMHFLKGVLGRNILQYHYRSFSFSFSLRSFCFFTFFLFSCFCIFASSTSLIPQKSSSPLYANLKIKRNTKYYFPREKYKTE